MRKFNIVLLLGAICLFAASCVELNSYDDMTGVFDDLARYTFTTATVGNTTEVNDTCLVLKVTFTDAENNSLVVNFGSESYILPTGTYALTNEVVVADTYTATFNGETVDNNAVLPVSGDALVANVDVTLIGDRYFIETYMHTSGVGRFVGKYKGSIGFVDPTAE